MNDALGQSEESAALPQPQAQSVAAPGARALPLGKGLRVVEGYLVAVLALMIGFALAVPAADFVYDVTFFRMLLVASAASLSFWLIERRARAARRFVPWALGMALGVSLIDVLVGGGYDNEGGMLDRPLLLAANALYAVATLAVIAYVVFAPQAKRVLAQPLGSTDERWHSQAKSLELKPFTWPWIRNLVIYYCASSIIGHWAEIGFCWLIVLGVVAGDYDFSHAQLWSEWLYPYPAEGIAVVLCVVFLYPLKEWLLKKFGGRLVPTLVVSFFATMAVCCAVDFLTGILVNADYHLWDYRDLPFNFMGQVVLQNTLIYSVAATFIVWVLYPFVARRLSRLRPQTMDAVFFATVGAYGFLEVLYFMQLTPQGILFG